MLRSRISFVIAGVLMGATAASAATAVVLSNDRTLKIENVLKDPRDLWVTPEDLKRVNGFELKPQGACLDEICIPVKQKGKDALVIRRDRRKWFNLTAFARHIGQAFVADAANGVWSFSEIPVLRGSFLLSGFAPDFALPDRAWKILRLSDFRGKKVLLLTWASW